MSVLRIRIDKYLDSFGTRPPHVPARVVPIGPSGTSNAPATSTLVPISLDPATAAQVPLPDGNYYVEAVLPTGEILSDTVELTAAGETLVLHADPSPNEWFSWQQLSGNLKTAPPAAPVTAGIVKKRSAGKTAKPTTTPSVATVPLPIGRPIQLLSKPRSLLVAGAPEAANSWQWLAQLRSTDAHALIQELNGDSSPVDLQVHVTDNVKAVYRLSLGSTGQSEVFPLSGSVQSAPRYFAVVPRRSRVELLSLPIPWQNLSSGQEAAIEVATQQIHSAEEFCASLVARDDDLGLLLGYLSSGSMPTVRQIAETAKEMLFYKVMNPYAAAAGGYAMVGTARETTADWHGWIQNLMNSFPNIPDGAIQWAQLRLRIRNNSSDLDEAKKALKMAYARGLPFYSMGIKWLMEGLEWISSDGDAEAGEMLENVKRISWLTNFNQPFTIVRIGGTA